jgi:hypothetical protein
MTQVLTDRSGLMLHVSSPMAGRRHDVTLFKKSAVPTWLEKHKDTIHVRADGGYSQRKTKPHLTTARFALK